MLTRRAASRRAAPFVLIPAAALVTLAAAGCATGNAPPGAARASASRPASAAPAPSSPVSVPPRAPVRPRQGPVPVVPEKTECKGWPVAPLRVLRLSFVPTAVLRCVTGDTTVPGRGKWLTATLERADQNLMPLTEALRAVSGHMRPGQICPDFVIRTPEIVLIGADGATIRPVFPVTACGQIQQPVLTALNALPWHTVSQRLIEKVPANQLGATSPGP